MVPLGTGAFLLHFTDEEAETQTSNLLRVAKRSVTSARPVGRGLGLLAQQMSSLFVYRTYRGVCRPSDARTPVQGEASVGSDLPPILNSSPSPEIWEGSGNNHTAGPAASLAWPGPLGWASNKKRAPFRVLGKIANT